MTRRKPTGIDPTMRAAWNELVASMTRAELTALNHTINRELTRRNRERKTEMKP